MSNIIECTPLPRYLYSKMFMKSKITLLLFFIVAMLFSCDDKDDDAPACSVAWGTELQNEVNAISAAANAYIADPSAANCAAYKTAYQNYVNKLEPYGNCTALTGQNRIDFQNALQAAKDSIANLC